MIDPDDENPNPGNPNKWRAYCHESIFNDTGAPVKVWWELDEGFPFEEEYRKHLLLKPGESIKKEFKSTGFLHEVCASYIIPKSSPSKLATYCLEVEGPVFRGDELCSTVTEIIGEGVLPPFRGEIPPRLQNHIKPRLSALELRGNHVEYFIPVLFALASFILTLIGLNTFRSFKKPGSAYGSKWKHGPYYGW